MTVPATTSTGTTVYVRGSGLERLGEVDDFRELDLTLAENAAGPWKLTMPAGHPMALALTFAGGLEVVRNGRLLMAGPVTDLKVDADSKGQVLEAQGYDDNDLLSGRITLPNPGDVLRSATGKHPGGYDLIRAPSETALRYFVSRNIGAAALPERRVADLVLDPDQGRGRTATFVPERFEPLLPWLARLARTTGLSFRIVQRGRQRVFTVRQPVDRSREVAFGMDRGNLLSYSLQISRPASNYVFTGGPGKGVARIVWVGYDNPSIGAFGRREVFLDQSGAQADDAAGVTLAEVLQEATQQELVEQRTTSAVSLQPQDTPDTQFGRDYDLGDTVTIRLAGGGTLVERIAQVRYVLTPDSERITPTVASDGQALATLSLAARLRRNNRRLSVLEGG